MPSPDLDETIVPGQPGHISDHETLHDLLNHVDAPPFGVLADGQGILSARPVAPPEAGRPYVWWATDTFAYSRWDGATWREIGSSATQGTFVARPAAAAVSAGHRYYATDQGIEYRSTGSTWQRMVGDPHELWITDFGAVPTINNPGATVMTANVAAFNAATAALGGVGAPDGTTGRPRRIVVPCLPVAALYWVNAAIPIANCELVGGPGSHRGQFGYKWRPGIMGISVPSPEPVFRVSNADIGSGGAALTIENLVIHGNVQALQLYRVGGVELRDVDMTCQDSTHANSCCLHIEDVFWMRYRTGSLTMSAGLVINRCPILMIAGSGVDIIGVTELDFSNLILVNGGVRFENRRVSGAQGADSNIIAFREIVTENQGTQPFFTHSSNGLVAHDIRNVLFDRVERADATTAGSVFIWIDGGASGPADPRCTMKEWVLMMCSPYSESLFQVTNRGALKNVFIPNRQRGVPLFNAATIADTTGIDIRGIVAGAEEGFGLVAKTNTDPLPTGRYGLFTEIMGDTAARWLMSPAGVEQFTGGSGDTGPTRRSGAGSPEGVVTATVGSTYHRYDGGAGTCFYVKESGTNNTGWVAK